MQEISAAVLAVVNWCIYLLLYLRYILTPSVIRQKKKSLAFTRLRFSSVS